MDDFQLRAMIADAIGKCRSTFDAERPEHVIARSEENACIAKSLLQVLAEAGLEVRPMVQRS